MGVQYSCRGWDGLFNKCDENLNSLVALKLSLYHKGESTGMLAIVVKLISFCFQHSIRHRRKCEHLITELVHQRDVTRQLIQQKATNNKAFSWLYQMRFYLDRLAENPLDCLAIRVADASFPYGWEYLGVTDRLVQTPLTDRCYLTLTQALDNQLGGAPFGPAGTGKTESVKALGVQLGRFVLVFCCDETFDFQAMGRIFVGLCQVGAWGCFDEFNRLEERILSAVSQQVQSIQQGLAALVKNPNTEIELVGKSLKINKNIGINCFLYQTVLEC